VPHQDIHVSKDKDTWHNQIMTSVKMKLAFQVPVNHESK
jgi:hypothetical protein